MTVAGDDPIGARSPLVGFGAGRRICPGQQVGERSLFIAVSHLLWAFDIKKAVGEDSKEIDIDTESFLPGLAALLVPFHCSIKTRSEHHADMIRKMWGNATATMLDKNEQWIAIPKDIESSMRKN